MSAHERPLHGGTHGPVVRIGDTVRRESTAATPAIQALLTHLERSGFAGAPRALGSDDAGREVVSFIPGQVEVARGRPVMPPHVRDPEVLVAVARLLRGLHDATLGFVPPSDAVWAFQVGAPRTGEVICHNDIGPWNTVFVDGWPVAFIDFDTAVPAPREWDIAYACYWFVPYQPDAVCALMGWPAPPDRAARLRAFCAAYGGIDPSTVLDVMVRRIEVMIATGTTRNGEGDPEHGAEWLRVMRPRLLRDLAFVAAQRTT